MVHILRAAIVPMKKEAELISSLDKYQRRYLSRRCCGLCEKQLDRPGCGVYGVYPPEDYACDEDTRIRRINSCMAEYKPRPYRRTAQRAPKASQ